MRTDYLILSDGSKVRFAFNMNALEMVNTLTGKEITDLMSGKKDIGLIRLMGYAAVIEGESIDGRKYELSEKQFGSLIDMAVLAEMSNLLAAQITGTDQKKSQYKEKPPKVITRKS